jgi:hypothetical protein
MAEMGGRFNRSMQRSRKTQAGSEVGVVIVSGGTGTQKGTKDFPAIFSSQTDL